MDELEKRLERVFQLSEARKYDEALEVCGGVIDDYPNDPAGYRKRAYIYARKKQMPDALNDIDKAIKLEPRMPGYFFTRGRWRLDLGHLHEAIGDFSMVIMLEQESETSYFSDAAYLFRAETHLKAGLYREALEDCDRVEDGSDLFVAGRMRSREKIQNEAREACE